MYIVYETKNIVNGKIYIGVHKQDGPEFDGYLGSGTTVNKAIKKYGVNSFVRTTLFAFKDKDSAYDKETELVTEDFIKQPHVYNEKPGGIGGWPTPTGKVVIIDSDGQNILVSTDYNLYQKGKLKSYVSGEKNPMYGKKQSAESNEKNRQWHLNKPSPSEETRAKWRQYKGEKSGKFIGWWILPNGKKYDSLGEAGEDTGIPTRNIARYCKEYKNKTITNKTYTVSQFLQSLGKREEIVGKTFEEIGFRFIEK